MDLGLASCAKEENIIHHSLFYPCYVMFYKYVTRVMLYKNYYYL